MLLAHLVASSTGIYSSGDQATEKVGKDFPINPFICRETGLVGVIEWCMVYTVYSDSEDREKLILFY